MSSETKDFYNEIGEMAILKGIQLHKVNYLQCIKM